MTTKGAPMTSPEAHTIVRSDSPSHRIARCSCGWYAEQRRQGQNARAAVAKLEGAVSKHVRGANGHQ